jgi:hypothetical protein
MTARTNNGNSKGKGKRRSPLGMTSKKTSNGNGNGNSNGKGSGNSNSNGNSNSKSNNKGNGTARVAAVLVGGEDGEFAHAQAAPPWLRDGAAKMGWGSGSSIGSRGLFQSIVPGSREALCLFYRRGG